MELPAESDAFNRKMDVLSDWLDELEHLPVWKKPIYVAYMLYVELIYACGLIGSAAPHPDDSEIDAARLNRCEPGLRPHLASCLTDLKALAISARRVKFTHALIALPVVLALVASSILARLVLPARLLRSWNYYYGIAVSRLADPRNIRDLALDVRPLILGWMTLAPPTALLLMANNALSQLASTIRRKSSDESLPGCECIRLVQRPDRTDDLGNISFYNSPAFNIVTLGIFAAGIPAAVSAWIYFNTGVDVLLGYPSHDPQFRTVFLCIDLYIYMLGWCLSALFFRSYFTFGLSFTSGEFDIEIYPDVIKVLPLKGWFRDFVLFRNEHVPHQMAWNDVVDVLYHPARLEDKSIEKDSGVLAPLLKAFNLVQAISKSLELQSDSIEIKSANRCLPIRLADLSKEQRAQLFFCLRKYAPSVYLDAGAQAALVGSPVLREPRYTEIWFDVLTQGVSGSDAGRLEPGKTLRQDTYTVADGLGSGGQAVVYKATRADGQPVILKEYQLVPGESLEVMIESARAFENESSLLGQLSHDRIVRLEDIFYEDNRVYLVLEYVEGTSLRQLVNRDGPLDENHVIALSVQMCDILIYLHGLNPPIVHRDFTPDNLLLEPDGRVKLIDFSVAQSGKDVKTGECAGKHAYTPPEQFRGQSCPQSDIYGLGATMYFLLVGADPEPISVSCPRADGANISPELDGVVKGATNLSLAERYESAVWLRTELEALIEAGERVA